VRYTVVWLASAEAELATIWLSATDRDAVSRAAQQIDLLLQREPEEAGESRAEGRILLIAPLGVAFEVVSQKRLARVLEVWRFRTHN
jgi:hypothetical protein